MPSKPDNLLSYLRSVLGVWRNDPRDDDELLARFTQDSDEEAFKVLVWRYGLLVWQSCTRVLGESPDAEDAFQTTFLALARKAGRLRIKNLAGWLHQVARQAALNARAGAQCRRSLEQRLRAVTQQPVEGDTSRAELHAALDEELMDLPERLRVPLLLHYMEGRSQVEVARFLGCGRSVLQRRLARGEAILRQQLERRGLTMGVGTLAALLTSSVAVSAVPARLIGSTARAAVALRSLPLSLGSSRVAAVVEGVLKTELATKMKMVTLLLGLTLGLAGGGVLAYRALAGNVPEPPPPASEARGKAEVPRQPGLGGRAAVQLDRQGDPLPEGALTRLGTMRLCHPGGIFAMAFAPSGESLATGGRDGTVRLWKSGTGKEIRTLKGPRGTVWTVAFAPDGKTVAAGGEDGMVRLWEAATGKLVRPLQGHEGHVKTMAFSSDGKTLATGDAVGTVYLWEACTGKEIRTLKGHQGEAMSIVFSPDGKTLATGRWSGWGLPQGTVCLWEVATGKEIRTLKGHQGPVLAAAFAPDGKTVASGGQDGTVRLWEACTGKEIRTLRGHQGMVFSVAFSPDGKTLATGGKDNAVYLWEAATGKPIRTLQSHKDGVFVVTFSPDGKTLAMGGWDGIVRLWEAATGKRIRTLQGHNGLIGVVAISPDSKAVLTGGEDGTVRLWEAGTGKEIRTLKGHEGPVFAVAFASDGKTVATGGKDGTVRLWKSATGKEIRTLKGHEGPVFAVAFASDGKTVATGGKDGTVRLWKSTTGKRIRTLALKGHEGSVFAVAFASDGKTVATGGKDGTVRLWKSTTGKRIRTLQAHQGWVNAVTFAPDGKTVAAGGEDGTVCLWEAATGKEIRTLQGYKSARQSITFTFVGSCPPFRGVQDIRFKRGGSHPPAEGPYPVFSPDGRILAVGSGDRVQLWDLLSGNALPPLAGHRGLVYGVTFSSDGRALASVSEDSTGLVWDLTYGSARTAIKRDPDALRALWTDLASPDAARARRAVWTLAATPVQSLPLIRARLWPVPAEAGKQLAWLIVDLDAADFKVRQKAYRDLEELGANVEPALRKGLEGRPSVEVRKRLEELLLAAVVEQSKRGFSGELLRSLRAVEVLERVGTLEARQVLKRLAAGAPGFRLTQEAQAALERLDRAERP